MSSEDWGMPDLCLQKTAEVFLFRCFWFGGCQRQKKQNFEVRYHTLHQSFLTSRINALFSLSIKLQPPILWLTFKKWNNFLLKRFQVVFIVEKRNCRAAVGILKNFVDKNRNFTLFLPIDSRIPRMVIPVEEIPNNLFDQSQLSSRFIYLANIAEWNIRDRNARGYALLFHLE